MKSSMTKMAYMLLVASMISGVTVSCGDDDPDYSNVTPPVVEEVKTSVIGGMVTAISGDPIQGANVTAVCGSSSLTAQTDAQGTYVFEGLTSAGAYTLTAVADGKLEASGSVAVKIGETATWNAQLASEGKEVEVSETAETVVTVTTESSKENEEAQVTVETVIPPSAVDDEDAKVIITPIYSDEDAAQTRATSNEEMLIAGMSFSCSNPNAKLTKSIKQNYQLDESVASQVKGQKYVNGKWQDMDLNVKDGNVELEVDEFTSYRLALSIKISTSTTSEKISFNQAEYNNLYGSSDMNVGTATYTYKQGAEVTVTVNGKMGAYLREILGRQLGVSVVKSVTGSYPLNVTLPIGTALTLSGKQTVETISVASNNVSVSGKCYGNVSVGATTYNRNHSGGTND